jgi:hypothetical protein
MRSPEELSHEQAVEVLKSIVFALYGDYQGGEEVVFRRPEVWEDETAAEIDQVLVEAGLAPEGGDDY